MIIKSLRAEIAVLALVSILAVSSLVLWFSINAYQSLYQQAASNDLDGLSENLAVALIPSVVEEDYFSIDNTLFQLEQYDNVQFAAVFDENGQVISSYLGNALIRNKSPEQIAAISNLDFGKHMQNALGMTHSTGSILAKKRIGDIQSSLGYLIIGNDLSGPLYESKQTLLWSILPWVVLTILLNIVVIFVFQNKALKPLLQLARFTGKIRDTQDYSLVAKIKGKREIAMVTDGLNSMMRAINAEVEKNKQKNTLLISQQAQMEKLANFDTLTGLPNRQFFISKLRAAIDEAEHKCSDVTLMFFDLDGFKMVNDSFGHEIGDRLLCMVASRITNIVGPGVEVARIGGDEFLVMLDGNPNEDFIKNTATQFIEGIARPIDIDHWNLQVGTSIGIAKASVAGFNLNELMANADIAMYRAKAEGRNRYAMFTRDMIENSRRRLKIANAISIGLSNNEFSLCYQPKVDTHGKTIGYEALARWTNQELGFVSPGEFIPIAEQSGKIAQITEWLIHQVCKDAGSIFAIKKNIKIALNLSVHDLKNKNLLSMFRHQMLQYNIRPQQIEFEITESAYLDNFSNSNRVIEEIKLMGSSIALDDFGTGYSSLSYLTQIDIDTLKIDKQFVDQIGISRRSTLVTKTIIEMAKHLNLVVCAEGVETQEQSKLLVECGCHIMQGYYFGRPEPLASVLKKLKEQQSSVTQLLL